MKRLQLRTDGTVYRPEPEPKPLDTGDAILHDVGPGTRIALKQGRCIHILQRNISVGLSNTRLKKYRDRKVHVHYRDNGGAFYVYASLGGRMLALIP